MKTTAVTLALGLIAAPAFAQSDSNSSTSSGSSNEGSGSASATSEMDSNAVASQTKVRDQLEQAGFQDVQILDASYLVRATTEDGNTVLMVIDPPVSGTGTSGSSTGTDSTSGSNSTSGSTTKQTGN